MERIILDFVIVVVFILICFGIYYIGKLTKNCFKDWKAEDKRAALNLFIPCAIVLGIIGGSVGGVAEKICFVLEIPVVIFIIILAGSLAYNNE